MLTQLQTPIPLQTPKGKAWAVAMIDYGPDWDLLWVTFVHDSGECWTFNNKDIRQEKNQTFGLTHQSPIFPPARPYEHPRHSEQNGSVHFSENSVDTPRPAINGVDKVHP